VLKHWDILLNLWEIQLGNQFDVRVTVHPWYEMAFETKYMQQLWFINNPLAQYVSGTIMTIFRSARLYITAYGFHNLMC